MENNAAPKNKKRSLTFWATIGLFLLTFGKNLFMVLKSAKFLTPFLSMLVSVGAYALLAPLEFAIGFVVLLFIHELGHVWAAKMRNLPVSAPLFIPFLGALIMMKRNPRDAETEAFVAIGGPVVGSLGALAFLWVGLMFSAPLMVQLAYVGLLLNLINLLPIHPLDGGRISVAVSRWLWLFGLVGGLVLIVFFLKSILFFIIWALFAWDLFQRYVLKRKNGRRVVSFTKQRLAVEANMPAWFIPAEGHRRELPWGTFSYLDGRQVVTYRWDGLDLAGELEMQGQCLIERVQVNDIRHLRENGELVALEVEVAAEAMLYENDRYYEVSKTTRFIYGASYAALATVIVGSMFWIHALVGASGLR
jgi:Zn-dependent protease